MHGLLRQCCPHQLWALVPVMLRAPSPNGIAYVVDHRKALQGAAPGDLGAPLVCSCDMPSVIFVSGQPGGMALTLTPMRPTSRAKDRVKPIMDALVTLYTESPP
jgi:hypothetical protein